MTDEFQNLFDLHWVPFARDLLDAFFMFGFCPWLPVERDAPAPRQTTKRRCVKRPKVTVPVVPTFGTYDIHSVVDRDYTQRLEFIPRQTQPTGLRLTDDRVSILVSTDGTPSMLDGSHRSLIATLLPKYRIMQHLFRGTLLADHIRSHPPLLTQDSPSKSRINDTLAEEPFGDPIDLEERRYKRNESDMKILEDKRRLAVGGNRPSADVMDPFAGTNGSKLGRKQAFQDNLFHLPDGTQVAPQQAPPPVRGDLMEIERERAGVVCGCFGVPQSLLLNGGQRKNSSGGSETDIQQLMRTIGAVASNATRALTEVYNAVYPDEDVVITLSIVPHHHV